MSHTNTELRNIIQNHFKKENKKMTNLTKATKDILMGIINKHNIELTEPKKKDRKKIEKKETLDTSNHPFKLGTFDYTYEWDDDNGAWGGRFTTVRYTITKITKCFITVEYVDYNGFNTEQPCKIKFAENRGWFFTIGSIHCKKEISFNKSINVEHQYTHFIIKKIWNRYH